MNNGIDINKWNNIKEDFKREFPILTDSDLLWRDGTLHDLLKQIAVRVGISWKDLEAIVKKL
ncbi:MAG: hypothetical protein PF517_13730 [Salinivirgaceae bacterium]|jgi:hypothetical protein|nr:hypothetical protein [Salinivirgaceae bacterium]